nr:HAD family hydrolase [uncultured Shimia sp.]
MRVDGILFDKDGTLFDFGSSWNVWAGRMIGELAKGDIKVLQAVAEELEFDLERQEFLPTSFVIAGTNLEVAQAIARAIPGTDVAELEDLLMRSAAQAPLVPVVPLGPFLDDLANRGLRLGVMTNDTEFSAQAHLKSAGVAEKFDFIAGFDSGYGAKPDPDPLLAFSTAMDVPPARVAMVGDSTHDLVAGRAAGMQTVAVLTGVAREEELAPFADVVLPDIGHLAVWLQA